MGAERRDEGSDFDHLARSNVVDQAHAALLDAILSGRIAPGAPLREARVAEQMGVSRAPVREACRLLAVQGVVRSAPNRGFFVRDFTETDIADIYEARAALETAALREAAPSVTAAQLAGLTALCDSLEAATRASIYCGVSMPAARINPVRQPKRVAPPAGSPPAQGLARCMAPGPHREQHHSAHRNRLTHHASQENQATGREFPQPARPASPRLGAVKPV